MEWEGWFTIGVVVVVLAALMGNMAPTVFVMFAAIGLIMTVQAITGTDGLPSPDQAVAGFGNSGLVTVGLLFVVVAGLVYTGSVNRLLTPLLGRPKSARGAQLRILPLATGMSAFLNNTPVVAMFIPVISDLCKRTGIPASKLMLPLSYATIFGGTCTLIGTSTNLVVYGLMMRHGGVADMGIFELGWVGVPAAAAGLAYIFLFSNRLLPSRGAAVTLDDNPREYTVEVVVAPNGPMVGKTIEAAGLRHLPGLFLIEIERDGRVIPAVSSSEVLQSDDRLVFAGVVDSVSDLHQMPGIAPATNQVFKLKGPRDQRLLIEAVVSHKCPVVGKSIREGRFRHRYDAAVIAVGRGGQRLPGKIGDLVLHAGDTLLLESHGDFLRKFSNSQDFYLVSSREDTTPRRHHLAWVAIAILMGMVLLAATETLSMLNASLLAAGLMLAAGCCTGDEARRSIDWPVLLVIGAALGLGQAMTQSGAATSIAEYLISLAGGSPWLVLLMVFAVTSLFTELITNNAAAVLIFPIAIASAERLGVNATPFMASIMMAASASFSTPFGYQTNLMVYGPGGYQFADYVRFGIPLNFIVMVVVVALAPLVWHF
ncbi:MAG: SLC13 family permease [Candidatus Hydrogenedens sp.]|nr:SLC13 family permease [Candidatus Hydrogenedens sp.]